MIIDIKKATGKFVFIVHCEINHAIKINRQSWTSHLLTHIQRFLPDNYRKKSLLGIILYVTFDREFNVQPKKRGSVRERRGGKENTIKLVN